MIINNARNGLLGEVGTRLPSWDLRRIAIAATQEVQPQMERTIALIIKIQ